MSTVLLGDVMSTLTGVLMSEKVGLGEDMVSYIQRETIRKMDIKKEEFEPVSVQTEAVETTPAPETNQVSETQETSVTPEPDITQKPGAERPNESDVVPGE